MAAVTGGDKLKAKLEEIERLVANAGTSPSVSVGFLEGGVYPDGTSIPMVAFIQEFGATIKREAGSVTVLRKVSASGTHFLRNGRFVKRRESNFSTTHATPAHTITIPPRPFFRNMIKKHKAEWPGEIAKVLKANDYDAKRTLAQMGDRIKGELQQSIRDLVSPPLAASTIRRKGFSKPLIDTGVMLRSVDYHVST